MVTDEQKLRVKQMLVKHLRLRMEPSEIEDAVPLFGEGLSLDSVDAIELVAALEQDFGVIVTSEEEAKRIFQNVDTLTEYIAEQSGF